MRFSGFVVWLAILLVAIIAFSAGIAVAKLGSTSTDSWLSFLGALIGASITVLGGVSILEWQRGRESRANRALLIETLNETIELTHGFWCADEPALREKTGRTVAEQADEIRRAIDRLIKTLDWMKPDSASMLRSFDHILSMKVQYDSLEFALHWKHRSGADLGELNGIGHELAAKAKLAIKSLES